MHSLIQFDFSLIQCNPMTIAWYLWRHRCERKLMKISWMVVCTWFRLWYYLCCIWFHSDLLWFSLLRDHIGHWHRHDRIAIIQDDKAIYIKSMGYYLCDVTGTSHFVHFIQNPLQPLQLPDLFPNEPCHLWQLHFEILQEGLHGMNSWLAHSNHEPGISDLGGALLACVVSLQPLAWHTIGLALIDPESFDLG